MSATIAVDYGQSSRIKDLIETERFMNMKIPSWKNNSNSIWRNRPSVEFWSGMGKIFLKSVLIYFDIFDPDWIIFGV